ncbi:MAG: glycosyltransferase family 2 protein [Desulfovibrionaceae bacterium]
MDALINKLPITAILLTTNSERLLKECLRSISFCERIIVVDGGSTDATLSIASEMKVEIKERPWDDIVSQTQYALSLIKTEWGFYLDSDEICTKELEQAIRTLFQNKIEHTGYTVQRATWYLDRFLLHGKWYPEKLLRLFKTEYTHIGHSGAHHYLYTIGSNSHLAKDILHYSYSGYKNQLDKLNSYAEDGACDLRKNNKKGGIAKASLHALSRFFVQYIIYKGFLDGRAGFILSVHEAFYVFCKYIRITEESWGKPYTYKKGDITQHKN